MTYEFLNKNFALSSYNEGTADQLDYFIDENNCKEGSEAYLYSLSDSKISKMKIVKVISRLNNIEAYDKLLENDDVLIDGEDEFHADTSAEFITNNNCYLVWFKYL